VEYRELGRTGVKVSPLCLGTGNFHSATPEEESIRILNRGLETGINFVDTGDNYAKGECELIIGRAMAANGLRDQIILATKVHYPMGPGPKDRGNSRLHIIKACEDSLRRLQTDHIDLYQIHRPSMTIPVDETLAALTDLIRQGKVLYIGCSTHPAWKVMESLMVSELRGFSRYVAEQPPYNLLDRRIENELIPMCQAYDLAILPWSPMAMGMLAGRYLEEEGYPQDSRAAQRGGIYAERVTAQGVKVGNKFARMARELGYSPAQLAVLWVKDQPGITAPIIGPRTLEQLDHLLPVMDMHLSASVQSACDELVPPGSAVANFHNSSGWMKMHILAG